MAFASAGLSKPRVNVQWLLFCVHVKPDDGFIDIGQVKSYMFKMDLLLKKNSNSLAASWNCIEFSVLQGY